jgi:hypothetical protein
MRINGKRVVDATKPLHISVSKRDAAFGKTMDPANKALNWLALELARLRLRPTEEELTRVVIQGRDELWTDRSIVRAITARFPKVQL